MDRLHVVPVAALLPLNVTGNVIIVPTPFSRVNAEEKEKVLTKIKAQIKNSNGFSML